MSLTGICIRRVLNVAYLERSGKILMCHLNEDAKKTLKLDDAEWTGILCFDTQCEVPGEVMKRYVFEKSGFTMQRYKMKNAIEFWTDRLHAQRQHTFYCDKFKGKLVQEDEYGTLEWVKKEQIKDLKLWRADRMFFKKNYEEGRKFFFFQGRYTEDGEFIRATLYQDNDTFLKKEEWDV